MPRTQRARRLADAVATFERLERRIAKTERAARAAVEAFSQCAASRELGFSGRLDVVDRVLRDHPYLGALGWESEAEGAPTAAGRPRRPAAIAKMARLVARLDAFEEALAEDVGVARAALATIENEELYREAAIPSFEEFVERGIGPSPKLSTLLVVTATERRPRPRGAAPTTSLEVEDGEIEFAPSPAPARPTSSIVDVSEGDDVELTSLGPAPLRTDDGGVLFPSGFVQAPPISYAPPVSYAPALAFASPPSPASIVEASAPSSSGHTTEGAWSALVAVPPSAPAASASSMPPSWAASATAPRDDASLLAMVAAEGRPASTMPSGSAAEGGPREARASAAPAPSPESPEPESPEPESPEPESREPESPEPGSPGPESAKLESPMPESAKPESPTPESAKLESAKPASPEPEIEIPAGWNPLLALPPNGTTDVEVVEAAAYVPEGGGSFEEEADGAALLPQAGSLGEADPFAAPAGDTASGPATDDFGSLPDLGGAFFPMTPAAGPPAAEEMPSQLAGLQAAMGAVAVPVAAKAERPFARRVAQGSGALVGAFLGSLVGALLGFGGLRGQQPSPHAAPTVVAHAEASGEARKAHDPHATHELEEHDPPRPLARAKKKRAPSPTASAAAARLHDKTGLEATPRPHR
jgi:hypothetical protein